MTYFGAIRGLSRLYTELCGRKRIKRSDLKLADEAVQRFSASATLWILRGMLLEMAAQKPPYHEDWNFDAAACYQRAVVLDPGNARGWTRLAYAREETERPEAETEAAFRQAIACSGRPERYCDLSHFLYQVGRKREAFAVIDHATEMFPGDSAVEETLSTLAIFEGCC